MTDDDIIRRVTLLNAEAAERAIEEIPYGIRSAGVIMFAQCFVAELRASVKAEPAPLAPVPRGACRPGSSDLANDASYLRPGVWTPPACAPKKSVPRGCCGRCDRCGESKLGKCCVLGQCSTFPQPTQRSHCAGCGAPYEAELSQADVNAAGYRENANEPLPTRKEGDACDSVARHNDRTGPANVTPPAVDSTSVAGEVMAFGPPNNATNTDAWRSTNWHVLHAQATRLQAENAKLRARDAEAELDEEAVLRHTFHALEAQLAACQAENAVELDFQNGFRERIAREFGLSSWNAIESELRRAQQAVAELPDFVQRIRAAGIYVLPPITGSDHELSDREAALNWLSTAPAASVARIGAANKVAGLPAHWYRRDDGLWNCYCPCGATMAGIDAGLQAEAVAAHLRASAKYHWQLPPRIGLRRGVSAAVQEWQHVVEDDPGETSESDLARAERMHEALAEAEVYDVDDIVPWLGELRREHPGLFVAFPEQWRKLVTHGR